MKRLVLAGLLVGGVVYGLIFLSDAPMDRLEKIAALHVARVYRGRDGSVVARPRKPYDTNVDKVIELLPFCPSVKEFRMVPIDGKRDRLARVAESPWIVSIDLGLTDAADDDLAALEGMEDLEWLDLTGNLRVTDAGIAHLAKCTRLRHLDLTGTSISGTGLAKLAACQELETLVIRDCPVTDDTVVEIPHFKQLTTLDMEGTKVTAKGMWHFLEWTKLKGYSMPRQIPDEERNEFRRQRKALQKKAEPRGTAPGAVKGGQ